MVVSMDCGVNRVVLNGGVNELTAGAPQFGGNFLILGRNGPRFERFYCSLFFLELNTLTIGSASFVFYSLRGILFQTILLEASKEDTDGAESLTN